MAFRIVAAFLALAAFSFGQSPLIWQYLPYNWEQAETHEAGSGLALSFLNAEAGRMVVVAVRMSSGESFTRVLTVGRGSHVACPLPEPIMARLLMGQTEIAQIVVDGVRYEHPRPAAYY